MANTNTTRRVAIETVDLYGPSVRWTLVDPSEIDPSAPVHLGHNEAARSVASWDVVGTIDPSDWCGWPSDLENAAIAILKDAGIDSDDPDAVATYNGDYIHDAAASIGWAIVCDEDSGDVLVCKPID